MTSTEMRLIAKMVAVELKPIIEDIINDGTPDKLYSTEEAAEYLKVSKSKLYHDIEIPKKKIGNKVYYRQRDLTRYINQ